MSTIFSLRRAADEDGRTAGGKIVRNRRARASERTPYARPEPLVPPAEKPAAESSGNPNWLTGLINPARAIASGAGRILSSVFGPDSQSSSSSSSGGDCYSEDEDDASNAADVDMKKVHYSMSTKSENMHLIQQLVMQQTFSREECDELIKLIRSRVVKGDGNLNNTDACNNVVMEARKWLEEKKSRSGSKLRMEDQIGVTNHGALSLASQSEMGSPVDMAKSYMQTKPTWSSPAIKHVEFRTPSPMQNYKENFYSPVQLSEMKGSALSTGSWNILDEIRRVRSKATEELLATTPSKISLASASLGEKSTKDAMTKIIYDEKIGDELNSDPNASLGLPATNGCTLPESVEMECENSHGGQLQTSNASLAAKQCQDGDTVQVIGDSDAANVTNPEANSNQRDGCRLPHEVNGLRDSAANDHALSLSAANRALETLNKEMTDAVDSAKENVDETLLVQLQNDHSNPVLEANDNDRHFSGSQDSSSMLNEEPLQDETQLSPNHKGKDTPRGRKLRPRNRGGKKR